MSRPPLLPPPGVPLSLLYTIRSTAKATEFTNNDLGVPFTFSFVRTAAVEGKLPSRIMGGARYFSTQEIFDWVASLSEQKAS